ncbi:MAG: T9SS type A sorting domain-containing protein [Endomicrobiia bacterium]
MKNFYKKIICDSIIILTTFFCVQVLFANEFKKEEFISGVALKDFGFPGWTKKYTVSTLESVRNSAARWISIHYFNSYTSTVTPTISSSWRSDGYNSNQEKLDEYKYLIQEAKKRGYKVCLISSLFFGEMLGGLSPEEEVALNESLYSVHNSTWYDNWFSSYEGRLNELADLANKAGADMLALGWNITYVTGDVKGGYNNYVATKWNDIIERLRQKFKGKIILPETTNGYNNNFLKGMEGFLDDLDYVSVHLTMDGLKGFSGKNYIYDFDEIKTTFETIFSTFGFANYYRDRGKKTIIFTTVTSSTRCFEGVWFEEMVPQPEVVRDFDAQKNVYQAMFEVLSSTDWIGGTFPWGYWWKDDFYKDEDGNNSYSFDKGPSIRKKPAEDVVHNFYSTMQKNLFINTTTYYEIYLNNKNLKAKIIIPEGTFSQNVNINISTINVSGFSTKSSQGEVKLLNTGLEIKNDLGLQPRNGIIISVYYRDSDISNVDETKLVFAILNEQSNFWEKLPSAVNSEYNHIVATITHLSKFAIIQPPDIDIDDAKVIIYPNPFKPMEHNLVTIEYLPEPAKVYIYTISGEFVRELNYDSTDGETRWDGKNLDGKMVSSGIYFVLIKTNKKSVIGKIAVIK